MPLWGSEYEDYNGTPATTATTATLRSHESDASSGGYHEALMAAEIANEVLRLELLAVEEAWAEEHASLLDQLRRKDEMLWAMAQQSSDLPAASAPGATAVSNSDFLKPERLGHRERPWPIGVWDLRGTGAMVPTPVKGKRARQYQVSKPAWDDGARPIKKAPTNKAKPAWPVPPNKQQPSGVNPGMAAVKKKPTSPAGLKKADGNSKKKSLLQPGKPKPASSAVQNIAA